MDPLEYEEEDEDSLFGDDEVEDSGIGTSSDAFPTKNTSSPIPMASSSRHPVRSVVEDLPPWAKPVPSGKPLSSGGYTPRARLAELEGARVWPGRPTLGVESLRMSCMKILRKNSEYISNVGTVPYALIKPFIDDLPPEQLIEIEENSPSLRKDTDWLWELFLLRQHSLFHDKVRMRQGEPRSHGWRRMYQKALEDAEERKAKVMERAAALYRKHDEEKAAKKIVTLEKPLPLKRKGGALTVQPSSRFASYAPHSSVSSAFNKARAQVSRDRIAMTHATGKVVPPRPDGVKKKVLPPGSRPVVKPPMGVMSQRPGVAPASVIQRVAPSSKGSSSAQSLSIGNGTASKGAITSSNPVPPSAKPSGSTHIVRPGSAGSVRSLDRAVLPSPVKETHHGAKASPSLVSTKVKGAEHDSLLFRSKKPRSVK